MMLKKIRTIWQSTKYITSWEIFYRNIKEKDFLCGYEGQFNKLIIDKGYWAADPLLFNKDNIDYLFFELWDNKKKKGVIACSFLEEGVFKSYKVVLDLDIHLSFPFVFENNGHIYMIPETGATHNIRLFKAIAFPYEWEEEKIIVDNVESSDTIVFESEGSLILLASIKNPSPSKCYNQLYKLDNELNVVKKLGKSITSNYGIRNAGQMFKWDNIYVRPGQDCTNDDYGIGLIMYHFDVKSHYYNEEVIKRFDINDVNISNRNDYSGIHTYSKTNSLEVIDLRIRHRRAFINRLLLAIRVTISRFISMSKRHNQ